MRLNPVAFAVALALHPAAQAACPRPDDACLAQTVRQIGQAGTLGGVIKTLDAYAHPNPLDAARAAASSVALETLNAGVMGAAANLNSGVAVSSLLSGPDMPGFEQTTQAVREMYRALQPPAMLAGVAWRHAANGDPVYGADFSQQLLERYGLLPGAPLYEHYFAQVQAVTPPMPFGLAAEAERAFRGQDNSALCPGEVTAKVAQAWASALEKQFSPTKAEALRPAVAEFINAVKTSAPERAAPPPSELYPLAEETQSMLVRLGVVADAHSAAQQAALNGWVFPVSGTQAQISALEQLETLEISCLSDAQKAVVAENLAKLPGLREKLAQEQLVTPPQPEPLLSPAGEFLKTFQLPTTYAGMTQAETTIAEFLASPATTDAEKTQLGQIQAQIDVAQKPYEDALKYMMEGTGTVDKNAPEITFLISNAEAQALLVEKATAISVSLAEVEKYKARADAVLNALDGEWIKYDLFDANIVTKMGAALYPAQRELKNAIVLGLEKTDLPALPSLSNFSRPMTNADVIRYFGIIEREAVVKALNSALADWQAWAAYKTKLGDVYTQLFGSAANATGEWKTFWQTLETRSKQPVVEPTPTCPAGTTLTPDDFNGDGKVAAPGDCI